MGREILLLVDALAREKNVDKEIVFGALELALASAAKKKFTEDVEVRASVDRATGEFSFFRRWEIVKNEEIEVPSRQYKLHEAQEEDPEAEVGEFIEEQDFRAMRKCTSNGEALLLAAGEFRRETVEPIFNFVP